MKYKSFIIYLGLVLIATGYILRQELNNLDEVWVYNFARCIQNGMLPYKDISMVITPLFPMLLSGILKIFGDELITLRILECFMTATILFMIYKIMTELKMDNILSITLTILMYFIYQDTFCLDYNWAVLLIELVLLYIELKNREKILDFNIRKEILLGILAGIAILCKQSSGLVFCRSLYIL